MAMLSHGGMGNAPPSVSLMADLYHPAKSQKNPAAQLLLTFEQRTLLRHLPAQMRLERTVPLSLLEECLAVVQPDLYLYWGDLTSHFRKHFNSTETPYLDAVCQAIRTEIQQRGGIVDPAVFPARVVDVDTYAALARAILFVGLLPRSPFNTLLYCARSPDGHVPYGALVLNIIVPTGLLGDREVILGLHLAVADMVMVGKGSNTQLFVPVLSKAVHFSTLYAPDNAQSSRSRANGNSCSVILQ
jgi:hypothetical protein